MAKKKSKTRAILSAVGREMKANPPKILAHTARKFGAADAKKQKTAILLSKARKAGADVAAAPKKKRKFNAGAFERARRSHYRLKGGSSA